MAIAGLVTGGATALGLAALTVSLHLPTKSYQQERQRRLSEPQSAGGMQATRAREAVLERMTSRDEARVPERRGSVTEAVMASAGGAVVPPGRRFSFSVGK